MSADLQMPCFCTTGSAISVPFFGSSGLGNWILSGAGAHPDPSSTPEAVDATPLDLHMVLGVLLKPQPDHS